MRWIILKIIRLYQLLLSPLIGPSCRFMPSCSEYMAISVRRFGVLKGGWLGVKRLLRCHPFGDHGYDPPPPVMHDIAPLREREKKKWI